LLFTSNSNLQHKWQFSINHQSLPYPPQLSPFLCNFLHIFILEFFFSVVETTSHFMHFPCLCFCFCSYSVKQPIPISGFSCVYYFCFSELYKTLFLLSLLVIPVFECFLHYSVFCTRFVLVKVVFILLCIFDCNSEFWLLVI